MFTGSYLDWNQKKIKLIVDHYGHPYFVHKKILDLGCGHGDMGGVLHRLGAEVTAVDARQEHLKIVTKKFAGVKTVRADLDTPWPFYGKTFDLTIDIGLLCYLKDFETHLRSVCASTTHLILETAVMDSNDPNAVVVIPDNKNYDSSFNGFNSQISPANIERVLRDCGMAFKRMDTAKLNAGSYSYDWQAANNGRYDPNKRRIWFCVNEVAHSQMEKKVPTVLVPAISPGVFSSHLVDSKMPITPQQIVHQEITTKSPAPPSVYKQIFNTTQTIAPTPKANLLSNTQAGIGSGKIRLFFNYYVDQKGNSARQNELDQCLQKNLSNTFFDLIVVDSKTNPTFDLMFQKINQLANENDISIICSSDISFDQTIKLISNIRDKEVYVLTRWETPTVFSQKAGQDAWVVRGKVENVIGNFQMGRPGSDFRIAHEFQAAGYTIINPGKSIKAYHNHQSGVKYYTEEDRVPGPYLIVEPF